MLHAEVWPVLFEGEVQTRLAADPTLIRDRAQVRVLCAWAERGRCWSARRVLRQAEGLSDSMKNDCVDEEGWSLGLP